MYVYVCVCLRVCCLCERSVLYICFASTHLYTHPYIYASIHPYICTSIYVHTFVHPYTQCVRASVHSYILHLYIHTPTAYIHTHPPIHPYVHRHMRPFIHPISSRPISSNLLSSLIILGLLCWGRDCMLYTLSKPLTHCQVRKRC